VILPHGNDIMFYAELPAEVRPTPVRILDLDRFPLGLWREGEYILSAEVVARPHATLAAYPELLPSDPTEGFDGMAVRLDIERLGERPRNRNTFRFRMLWTRRELCSQPAVQMAWELFDAWRLNNILATRQAEPHAAPDPAT
jgi:hypothetical protein